MDSKSRRQRYTRQWKCARRSLPEMIVEEQLQCNPITFQHGQDPINMMERNDHDTDMQSAFECVENEGSEQNCSPGHEGVEYGVIEGNCSSGQNSGIDAVSEANCSSGTVEMPPASLTMFLQEWSMKHLITHNAIDDLLRGLQKHGHPELPSTARTLLRTPRQIKTLTMSGMHAFPFENFLGKIKRLVRSGKQPLAQVAKRLMEISVSPQTQSVVAAKCKLSRPNNGFILGEGKCYSFEKALQKCQRATETSNIETVDTSIKKRPHKKPSRFHSENDITSDDYRTKVLQKLQELVENQQDILAMQRTILAALAPSNMADEDILDGPCQTLEDFAQLDKMLENGDKRTKMLNYLRSLGGADEGAAVRKMMCKVASTEVLSAYSLKGRKGKLAFQSLRICNIIIKATQKNFKTLKAIDVEDLIALVLKFAPHRNLKR
ncbi:hypothetical protein E1301_Tti016129 [Triplophysa tibetana]|uniref:DUF4806 domain-containing protein n=1 Tax=Triplophysa tibetana TaxID=1572043 RepID=A0A5A9P2W5_9TELE|nr:hypothetical protein E1301_Tti016129 [Triplophysa tibetana]